jgi:hypothetical protein
MAKLLEGLKMDFDHILEKSGETIQGGYYSREDTNYLRKYVTMRVSTVLADMADLGSTENFCKVAKKFTGFFHVFMDKTSF